MRGLRLLLVPLLAASQQADEARLKQHKVTNPSSPAQHAGAENLDVPSLVEGLRSAKDWHRQRRPQLLQLWTTILGRLEPARQDRKYFGDIRRAVIREKTEEATYTRILLDLPMETDFLQPHLLLIPKGTNVRKRPAVICWTSTTPDFRMPEQWWGKWLVERGYVVLTGWSFLRNYRDGTDRGLGAATKHRERFGHWLPLSRMAWDVRREAEYLRRLPEVDGDRIGFMGFSLSAKAALYVGAFAPEIRAVVAIDPHIALNGGTNYYEPWYLDWMHSYEDIPTPSKTVLSLLDSDPSRPGLEHDHHELLALTAPRPFLLIGGRGDRESEGGHSDDGQSWGYINRAREVYTLLGVPVRLQFVLTADGHTANGPTIDPAWQSFLSRWLGEAKLKP
ncbi:MAG TPA: acyl-CoA thioester hydrolase/BAAT C-terminal domain-containing protein [Bryobacteraceae bacterium]|nr:acyl-CoA thioester hydrolase/BAAT C-terminal domain-containing protein [Bryobacteraceae bacterium]